ncbi:hypothetical protein Q31b_15680 [Novipirellula aureliae]|uniref:Uncharacterized protein n=1 Tax=Novipirellula aureliae TaxID=2527966 RepID=A0A5C6E309_9BACT|nr:hypothetical protein [Novipirellula aureliae]TWU44033.1 hypothetical protein Q31b_15680 [Novipirellula aureliae]
MNTKYRHRYFLFGLLLVLFGVQFRMIDTFVLNESTTRTLARFKETSTASSGSMVDSIFLQVHPKPMKRVQPPRWIGLSMIALGAVISLHAVAVPSQNH